MLGAVCLMPIAAWAATSILSGDNNLEAWQLSLKDYWALCRLR